MRLQLNTRETLLARAMRRYQTALANVRPDNDKLGVIGYLTRHGISFNVAQNYQLGLVIDPVNGDERFAGTLSIPYLTPRGIKAMRYRSLVDGDGPKYNTAKGQKPRLYNTKAYFAANDTIGLSEGEIDSIVATETLGIATMGIPGCQAWQSNEDIWLPLFRDYTQIIIFIDGDSAGDGLGSRLVDSLTWRAKPIRCPDGEDVVSMCASGNGHVLREAIDRALRVEE